MVMSKQTDNVAQIGSDILLFRKGGGANRSFTARVAGFADSSSRSIGIGMQPLPNRNGERQNSDNSLDTQTVISDSNGRLEFSGAVAGSSQIILVDETRVEVVPQFDGEFVGSIPIVESGYSFKVTGTITDNTYGYLYGQGYDSYTLQLSIANIGDEDCETSEFHIYSEDPNLVLSGDTSGNFSSIEPRASKEVTVFAQYNVISQEYVDASIRIEITDSSLSPRTWKDYVVLRFYKKPLTLRIKSTNLDASNSASLKGFLMHPDGNSQHFSVSHGSTENVILPWSTSPYKLVFSGANASTEMKYAFVVGSGVLPDLSRTWTVSEINAFEPNESETNPASINNPLVPTLAYLKKSDIDYFVYDVSSIDSAYVPVVIDAYADDESTGNMDGIPNPYESMKMDIRLHNMGSSRVLGLQAQLSTSDPYVTITSGSYTYGNIDAGFYKTIYDTYSSSYPSDADLGPSASNAFTYSISGDCPTGHVIPFTLTMTDSWGNQWTDSIDVTVSATGASMGVHAYADDESAGNMDGLPNPHEDMRMDIRLHNEGSSRVLGLQAQLSTSDPYVTITSGSYTYGNIDAGFYKTIYDTYSSSYPSDADLGPSASNAFTYSISGDCPTGHVIPFTLTMTDSWGNQWTDSIDVTVSATGASMGVHAYADDESAGNMDGLPNPYESMKMDIRVHNEGSSRVLGLQAQLSTSDPYVTITRGNYTYGNIDAGFYKTIYDTYSSSYPSDADLGPSASNAFTYSISGDCPTGHVIPFTLTMTDSWGNQWIDSLFITVR